MVFFPSITNSNTVVFFCFHWFSLFFIRSHQTHFYFEEFRLIHRRIFMKIVLRYEHIKLYLYNVYQYHGYTWWWGGKVCRAGNFSGGFCVWCVKIFFSHFLSGQSIDTGQTKTDSKRLISLYLFAHFTCSIADWFGHIIFTHQTPPEKLPALQTFPPHHQVYPWYSSQN